MAKPTKASATDEPVVGAPGKPGAKQPKLVRDSAIGNEASPREEGPKPEADPVLTYLAQAVRKARRDLDLTQADLASRAKLAASAIFLVETARQNTTIKSLIQLAAALNLKVGDLLPRTEYQPSAKLKTVAEVLNDSSRGIALQLRTLDRAIADLVDEAEH